MKRKFLFCQGYSVKHPNEALTALTAFTGDSTTMINFPGEGGRLFVFDQMVHLQAAGVSKLIAASNAFHDTKDGLVHYIQSGTVDSLMSRGELYEVLPNDTVTPYVNCASSLGDIENMVVNFLADGEYPVDQQLISFNDYQRMKNRPINVYATLTAGTAGGYSGDLALSSFTINDIEQGDMIAITGITTTVLQAAIVINGPDTGFRNIAVPGNIDYSKFQDYFLKFASFSPDEPRIPVISGKNLGNTIVKTVNNENAASPIVTIRGRKVN